MHAGEVCRNVGDLADREAAVREEHLGIGAEQLVLRRARESDVARHAQRRRAGGEGRGLELFAIFLDPPAAMRLVRFHPFDLLLADAVGIVDETRSEEHTSELQSLMRISYAVFCLKKKK